MKRRVIISPDYISFCPRSQTYAAWCLGCGKETNFVSLREAASIVGTNLDTLIEHVAKGGIHLGVRPEALLLCLDSLLGVEELSFSAALH